MSETFIMLFVVAAWIIFMQYSGKKEIIKKAADDQVEAIIRTNKEQYRKKWGKYIYGKKNGKEFLKLDEEMLEAALGFIKEFRALKNTLPEAIYLKVRGGLFGFAEYDTINGASLYPDLDIIAKIDRITRISNIELTDIQRIEFCPHGQLKIVSNNVDYPNTFLSCRCVKSEYIFRIKGRFIHDNSKN